MHQYPSRLFLGLTVCLASTGSGCVALNLPSDRYHDPADHGGIFGPWKSGVVDPAATEAFVHGSSGHRPSGIEHAAATLESGVDCIGGDSLEADPFDTNAGEFAKPPDPPEVPWPRFHPVPTRPVFGG
jgi:hypothetical protein